MTPTLVEPTDAEALRIDAILAEEKPECGLIIMRHSGETLYERLPANLDTDPKTGVHLCGNKLIALREDGTTQYVAIRADFANFE